MSKVPYLYTDKIIQARSKPIGLSFGGLHRDAEGAEIRSAENQTSKASRG